MYSGSDSSQIVKGTKQIKKKKKINKLKKYLKIPYVSDFVSLLIIICALHSKIFKT